MLIEKLESKIKLAIIVSATSIIGSCIICIAVFFASVGMVNESHKQIYVLSGNVPIVANQTNQSVNLEVEAKSHVQLFHNFFFTLPPDDEYINYTLEKAMYLIDESGLKQKNGLQEKGFYAGILSQSANFSIMVDSVKVDIEEMTFKYYGTQRIERKTSIMKRELVTGGKLRTVPRTINNPHGLIITDYKTISNTDGEYKIKSSF